MDARTFDRWTVALADRANRRGALRLLAGGVLGGLLARGAPARALQERPDRDGDGLFDDDELVDGINAEYGTDPDNWDTDGDLIGDGEEIYYGTDPLSVEVGPAPVPTCRVTGARCDVDAECCPGALCCFNGGSLANHCTDVAATGGACPVDAPPAPCSISRTTCGGACVDTLSDPSHCGACFNSCPLGLTCDMGVCCGDGHANCGGYCANLQTDMYNCGRCRNICDSAICNWGRCAPI